MSVIILNYLAEYYNVREHDFCFLATLACIKNVLSLQNLLLKKYCQIKHNFMIEIIYFIS